MAFTKKQATVVGQAIRRWEKILKLGREGKRADAGRYYIENACPLCVAFECCNGCPCDSLTNRYVGGSDLCTLFEEIGHRVYCRNKGTWPVELAKALTAARKWLKENQPKARGVANG